MLRLEIGGALCDLLGLGKNLQAGVFGTEVVEEELGTRRSLDEDATGKLDGLRPIRLAILQVLELVGEVADVVGDVVLVRVRLALGVELVDGLGSDLEILKAEAETEAQCQHKCTPY